MAGLSLGQLVGLGGGVAGDLQQARTLGKTATRIADIIDDPEIADALRSDPVGTMRALEAAGGIEKVLKARREQKQREAASEAFKDERRRELVRIGALSPQQAESFRVDQQKTQATQEQRAQSGQDAKNIALVLGGPEMAPLAELLVTSPQLAPTVLNAILSKQGGLTPGQAATKDQIVRARAEIQTWSDEDIASVANAGPMDPRGRILKRAQQSYAGDPEPGFPLELQRRMGEIVLGPLPSEEGGDFESILDELRQ